MPDTRTSPRLLTLLTTLAIASAMQAPAGSIDPVEDERGQQSSSSTQLSAALLSPQHARADALAALLDSLDERCAALAFDREVALVGDVDAIARLRALASDLDRPGADTLQLRAHPSRRAPTARLAGLLRGVLTPPGHDPAPRNARVGYLTADEVSGQLLVAADPRGHALIEQLLDAQA